MIAPADTSHRLTVGELLELLHQYVEHNGLSLDALVDVVVCDAGIPDDQTYYPATMLSCHVGKSELYLYAANEGNSYE
jgi:hypothetical protein